MKKLFATILILLSVNIYASEVYVLKNRLGGQIVLTDKQCPFPEGEIFLYAYTWADTSKIEGCWVLIDRTVHVIWDAPNGPVEKQYNPRDFVKKHVI